MLISNFYNFLNLIEIGQFGERAPCGAGLLLVKEECKEWVRKGLGLDLCETHSCRRRTKDQITVQRNPLSVKAVQSELNQSRSKGCIGFIAKALID